MTMSQRNQPLALMAENERALALLYEQYAHQLPQMAAFWRDPAEEERHHATLIASLERATSAATDRSGRFAPEAIRIFTDYLNNQERNARKGITATAALSTAYYIEIALLERRFFEQFPQDDPAASRVMSALRRETESHVRKVKDALPRTGPSSSHNPG